MKRLFINKDNLNSDDIHEEAIRVKAIIKNTNGDILIEFNNNTYQFPGGHREGDEYLETTLKREVREEAGIDIDILNGPFMMIEEYIKNYCNSNKNRHNKIYYYEILCDSMPDINKIKLTAFERQTDFSIFAVKQDHLITFIEEALDSGKINSDIADEMIEVLKVYNKFS